MVCDDLAPADNATSILVGTHTGGGAGGRGCGGVDMHRDEAEPEWSCA